MKHKLKFCFIQKKVKKIYIQAKNKKSGQIFQSEV